MTLDDMENKFLEETPLVNPTYEQEDLEKIQVLCQNNGWEIVWPGPDQAQVDIDDKESQERFNRAFPVLRQIYKKAWTTERPSKSGEPGKKHITVQLGEAVDNVTRLLIQAALGSDPVRELLGLKKIKAGWVKPTFLFKKLKEEAVSAAPAPASKPANVRSNILYQGPDQDEPSIQLTRQDVVLMAAHLNSRGGQFNSTAQEAFFALERIIKETAMEILEE